MKPTTRNYRATFILDQRGQESSLDQLIESVKGEIAAVEGAVATVQDLGKRDFARVTDRKFTGAHYVRVDFTAPPTAPSALQERLRLNHTVYRAYFETV